MMPTRDARGEGRANGRAEVRGGGRAAEAVRHTEEVGARLAAEIERAAAGTRAFEGAPRGPWEGRVPAVAVADQDSVTAVLERGRGLASRCDLAVLDFASFTRPAGAYERGAWGQEQALCAASFLYNVLRERGDWYAENRRRNLNCHLYRNRALVVPRVRFERDGYHSYADVIVAAAPDARRAREEYHVSDDALLAALRDRVRLALSLASELGHGRAVLGAFGCGVFGWDAATVAEVFRSELASGAYALDEVTFAVPRGRADEHLEVFEHAFAAFPDANPEPYVSRAERAAEAERAAASAAEDDEEEDWRRYL